MVSVTGEVPSVPLVGETESQLPPLVVAAVAVNCPVLVDVTVTVCDGVDWPTGAVKVRLLWLAVMGTLADTFSATGMVMGLPVAFGDVMVTRPPYGPGERFEPLTPMV